MVFNLTKHEYARGAELAMENTECHLSIARKIAETENFGMAISHLILASEELAKATYLKIRSYNEVHQVKNLEDYFRHHHVKHIAIIKIASVALMKDLMSKYEDTEAISKEKLPLLLLVIAVIVAVALIDFDKIREEIEKIPNKLTKTRERGLYVDYDPTKKMWSTPAMIHTEKEWKDAEQMVSSLIEFLKRSLFSDNISRDDIQEFIKHLADENIVAPDLKDELEELGESLS